MGATSQLPSTYQNHCTVALILLLLNTPICKLTFHYLLLRSPECKTLPLGGPPGTPIDNIPKTLWKPRITLMAEVNNLINGGMVDDYLCKSEHSTMGEEAAAGADVFPPLKAEVQAPPLDTSSQVSVEEMETSQERNPINVYSSMTVGSNCSDSPMIDLMEFQAEANLAANHMLSIKRSLDLERQWEIWDFEASLHQQEAKEATANERVKIVHSRKDLKCQGEVHQGSHES